VQAHGFTSSARAAIEAAGGKCEVLSPTTGQVLQAVEA
jgi:ribosomal protein L18E